ncbi:MULTISPECIES: dihydrofolate reductase [Alphaproteobacteria]|uniref:Dihydrofolate reductase n=2 Tax=Alphaproteobacteria TaxID=28211 RepID=A0A512HMX2_9HYPH|nr:MULTISPECIES: dihydrofolate reductase [Alphaproteobacteria]GEO86793.1 dihydrofolate reductase [Ciceribacter naphthalenivorans]GLR23373.1 dihydrofolate reductase [Ciceribacter naphthalenivorans]GLT06229.1 dihydrofolate reductase [Sphingomonas psychrolutea]
MNQPNIAIVVAMAENGVIGRDGDMPWKLSTDLKRFKALTVGKPLVMGRKTFESVGGKPLPGRPHVIVSRGPAIEGPGVETASNLEAALARAKEIAIASGVDAICVAGGGEIYRQALPLADTLHVTHIEAMIEGDTVFPAIDPEVFEKIEETPFAAGEKDNYPTRYAVYRRRPAA